VRASVIIPSLGRSASVQRTLRTLLAADPRKRDVEVLVVDNNSDYAISGFLRECCDSAGDPVRYVAEPSPGATAARHRGAKEAAGDILLFIDDDVDVSPGWLDAILNTFEDPSVGIAGGPSIPVFPGSIPAWFWAFLQPHRDGGWWCGWLSLIDVGRSLEDIDPVWIWTLNFAVRRKVLFELGGFHPDLVPAAMQRWQGDGETGLTYKAQASGVRAVYVQEASVHHNIEPGRLTPEYFAKRAYFQGISDSFTRVRSGTPPSATELGPKPIPAPPAEGAIAWAHAAHEVQVRCAGAYNQGWEFHQREVAGDPSLVDWVRRANFWDTDIRQQMPDPGAG
jgi:glucosyl-dolichyl phosphate glucuronosyltransferase